MSKLLVSVCLCTYKRPGLIDTLNGLSQQCLPDNVEIEVVLVDSDLSRSASCVIQKAKNELNLLIRDFVADKVGISAARNKAVEEAKGQQLLFIDDDEVPDPQWISSLLNCANKYDAVVVFGRVKTVYPPQTPSWIIDADLFAKKVAPSGTIVKHGPTCNTLVSSKLLKEQSLVFSESYGVTGGEDTELFYRLYKQGAKMVTCTEALVSETIEAHRLNKKFIIKKALRVGETYSRIFILEQSFLVRWYYLIRAIVQSAISLLISALVYPFNYGKHVRFMILAASNLGKVRASVGVKRVELYKG